LIYFGNFIIAEGTARNVILTFTNTDQDKGVWVSAILRPWEASSDTE
jgi:hypothetical protein